MQRPLFDIPHERKVLRPHQQDALDMIRASAISGNTRIVVQLPTGAGKTLIASHIIRRSLEKGHRVLFTAPAITLIDQTVAAFEAEGLDDIGVMQADHPRTAPDAKIQVASVQTLARRDVPDAALVIVDECHQRSMVLEALMRARPDVFFIGLTATPGGKGMGALW